MDAHHASHQIIADLLAQNTGQHLTESRRWRVTSALGGLFREHGISNVDQLVCLLESQSSPAAKCDLEKRIVEAMLNNETYFFRDKPTFDQLPAIILPDFAKKREDVRRISIWCAGCSTGQEVYSLAMLFADDPGRWQGWTIEILGSDISSSAIDAARGGVYSQFEVQRGLGIIEMLRHFDETKGGWRIKDDTRKVVRFQEHNILSDPPVRGRFDLILCRNVLLYFDQQTRITAFNRLASALAPDGYLMLGAGETVVGQTQAFAPSQKGASLYQRRDDYHSDAKRKRALAN